MSATFDASVISACVFFHVDHFDFFCHQKEDFAKYVLPGQAKTPCLLESF